MAAAKNHNEVVGYNSRLDELQAAMLSIKLKHLAAITDHKRMLASMYFEGLPAPLILPQVHEDYFDVYHIFNVRTPHRDALKTWLFEKGIKTEIHYPIAPHAQKAMARILTGQYCDIAEEIHQTTLSLPISLANRQRKLQ